jgi:hypothetical protein
MSRLRPRLARVVVGLAVAVGSLVGVTAITNSTPAEAATTLPCVSKSEFRSIRDGMTQYQVAALTGTWGKITSESYSRYSTYISRTYRPCVGRPWSFVDVDFYAPAGRKPRVDYKYAYWG